MIFSLAMLVYLLFFIIPLGSVIKGGFFDEGGFTLAYLTGVFSNPIYREGLFNSLLIGLGTTLLATLIALPLAWTANRFKFPLKSTLTALLLVPMILPPFVGAIGFQQIFGQYGVLNAALHLGPIDWLANGRYFGVIVLQALSLYPIMYLNVAASLANIDHAMLEAAENMGCSGFTTFRRITLPLIMPGIFAGGTIIFIWGFTELGTPLIMNFTRLCAGAGIRCSQGDRFESFSLRPGFGHVDRKRCTLRDGQVCIWTAKLCHDQQSRNHVYGNRGHRTKSLCPDAAFFGSGITGTATTFWGDPDQFCRTR